MYFNQAVWGLVFWSEKQFLRGEQKLYLPERVSFTHATSQKSLKRFVDFEAKPCARFCPSEPEAWQIFFNHVSNYSSNF